MDTDKHGFNLPEGELTRAIIGASFDALKGTGHGLHEKPYENALVVEMGLRGLRYDRQRSFPVVCKGVSVGEFIPDLTVGRSVIVDAKVIDRITDHERGQMLNYFRIAKLNVGLIINFKKPKLEWERVVL